MWENTAAAFAAAHAAGAEYLETDCRVTADGDVVLVHDETMARLADDPRRVDEVRTRELSRMFEAHGGLLTVADALDLFPTSRFNIDVKAPRAADLLGPVLVEHTHRTLVTSFSDGNRRSAVAAVLRAGAALRPATSGGARTIAAVRGLTALHLSPARILRDIDALQVPERRRGVTVLTPALVRAAHAHGTEVHVWTVDDPAAMRRLVSAGVDGIVTDRADVAVDVLARE